MAEISILEPNHDGSMVRMAFKLKRHEFAMMTLYNLGKRVHETVYNQVDDNDTTLFVTIPVTLDKLSFWLDTTKDALRRQDDGTDSEKGC